MKKTVLLCICSMISGILLVWLGLSFWIRDINWFSKLVTCAYYERKDDSLDMAVRQGDCNKTLSALKNGADPNALRFINGWTFDRLLAPHLFPHKAAYGSDNIGCMAIYQGNSKIVDLLLSYGYSCTSSYDATQSLATALSNKDTAIISKLLNAGADPNVSDYSGATPLMFAVREGNAEATRLLLDHGAAPCSRYTGRNDSLGLTWITPLFYSVESGNQAVVSLLLKYGADPNDKAKDGTTPLHLAAKLNKSDIVRILLEHGADITVKDMKGRTAYEFAKENGSSDAISVLGH